MYNICGCLVHAMPEKAPNIVSAIDQTEGCEVHAFEGGRIVVTVEDTDTRRASEIIMGMHQIPGVITVTLTYHHFEASGAQSAAAQAH
ncbi:chaperone NapD [Shimia sp. R11_0]|uniref:chaperone NapD n=1 Tax=Shimia sp. R11_0 TaxID=2821096 RepID=UPI001ADA28E3|nr:chaperone NapD [Shimia sp. R11_0]MBO9477040.1 chaperone NapD [Shimia sp. R11_0]